MWLVVAVVVAADVERDLGVAWLVKVVEEYAANTATLVAVLDDEVVVAPLLVRRIVGLVVLVARGFQRLVEMCHVSLVQIVGRQVGASTEPPSSITHQKSQSTTKPRWVIWVLLYHSYLLGATSTSK